MTDDSTDNLTPRVGNLADDISAAYRPQRRTLTGFLDTLRTPKAPGDAGGVPVPTDWECFRAVLGGASRSDLEQANGPRSHGTRDADALHADARVQRATTEGTHLPPGLHIVTGQTGGGKSALVVNLANAAAEAGHPVLYVSLELDGAEIAARFLGLASTVPWYRLALRRELSAEDAAKRQEGEDNLTARGIPERVAVLVPDAFDAATVHAEALGLWKAHGKVPLVVLDYLQMATVRTADSYRAPLREAVAEVVKALRTLSRHLDTEPDWPGCPVVVLSTTARANVKGEGAVDGLGGEDPDKLRHADLETLKALPKEAGEVEATAVTAWVVGLGDKDTNGTRPLTLRLVKNRLGLPGQWIPLTFHGATGLLEESPARYRLAAEQAAERAAKGRTVT
jgi:hypothetical protein